MFVKVVCRNFLPLTRLLLVSLNDAFLKIFLNVLDCFSSCCLRFSSNFSNLLNGFGDVGFEKLFVLKDNDSLNELNELNDELSDELYSLKLRSAIGFVRFESCC